MHVEQVGGLCGTFSVSEDRAHPERRTIGLLGFVLPATAAKKQPDPLFLIEGGPGQSTVEHLSEKDLVPIYRQAAGARVEQQKAACAIWAAGRLPKGWDSPRGSKVPILFMAGSLDVTTSPARARSIAAPFPTATVVEVAHGTHLLVGQLGEDECVLRIEGDFLQKGSANGLDIACAAALPRGPWK